MGKPGFETALEFVLDHEGGLSEDPRDPGGLTNFGISSRNFPELDVKNLTRDEASAIYEKYFWGKLNCAALPPILGYAVFDTGVNMGVYAAASMLQHTLGIHQDGLIGPLTVKSAQSWDPRLLLCLYLTERIMKYTVLTTFQNFGKGWVRRVLELERLCLEDGGR